MECIINDGEGAYISTIFAREGGVDGDRIIAYDRHKTCLKLIDCFDENDDAVARVVTFSWSQPCGKVDDWLIFDDAFSDGEFLDWVEEGGNLPVDDFSPYSGRVQEYGDDLWTEYTSDDKFVDVLELDIYEPKLTVERQGKDICATLDCYGFMVDIRFEDVISEKYLDIADRVYFSTFEFEGSDRLRWSVDDVAYKAVNGVKHMLKTDVLTPEIICRRALWRVRFVPRGEDGQTTDGAGKLFALLRDDFNGIERDGDRIILRRRSSVRELVFAPDGFEAVVDGAVVNRQIREEDAYLYARDFFGRIAVREIEGEVIDRARACVLSSLILDKASGLVLVATALIAGIVLLALKSNVTVAICLLVVAAVVAVVEAIVIAVSVKKNAGEYLLTGDALYLSAGGYLSRAIWLKEISGAKFKRMPLSSATGTVLLTVRGGDGFKVSTLPVREGEKFCRSINLYAAKLSNSAE